MIKPQSQIGSGAAERAKQPSLRSAPSDRFPRQAEQIQQLLSLLGGMPDAQPPPGLVQRTLQRVDAAPEMPGISGT